MALAPANDRKRVKVYELKNNDWYDRGTGFCTGLLTNPDAPPEALDARVVVSSEEDGRTLLETRITKDDGYQKQQETLIVWTESDGVDMALSFQEAEGCASIWKFVNEIQSCLATDDGITEDLSESMTAGLPLPEPQLGRLQEVEDAIREAASTTPGRDTLAKFVMRPDQMYILKLAPLVRKAEEQESLHDLNKLCNIMKHLILLNDTSIIEFIVTDNAIMGVVGALEYDPDFPSHRANHRQYLSDTSKFKEVVRIDHEEIRKKIHYTYRLLYLKDVVLARILDDPTFSVLNSLIFFHQVDIVNYLQSNRSFLQELFSIFNGDVADETRKKEAVLFIQNCCAVAKNIQMQSRAQLYQNLIHHGLFDVITFSLRHHDASVRVASTDILVSLIDHDAQMVRSIVFKAVSDKTPPLTDTLIELLLVEVDLGVKSQLADAIKILLDPSPGSLGMEMMARQANGEYPKRGGPGMQQQQPPPQTEAFIATFYEEGAKRLFQPLQDLEHRKNMIGLTVQDTTLYTHLVEVLCFFVRQHSHKSKMFILSEGLHARIAQLFQCPQKYMKLTALRWFRVCISLQDEHHNRQLLQLGLFDTILHMIYETFPRDNLLNSACYELFEYIKREGIRPLVGHLVERHRHQFLRITHVPVFHELVKKYDEFQHHAYLQSAPVSGNGEGDTSFTTEPDTPEALSRNRIMNGRQAFSGLREPDVDEDAYFTTDDDDGDVEIPDDDDTGLPTSTISGPNFQDGQQHPPGRPLVDYSDDDDDDDDDEAMDMLASSPEPALGKDKYFPSSGSSSDPDTKSDHTSHSKFPPSKPRKQQVPSPGSIPRAASPSSSDSMPMKRRRDDLDDGSDELGKMMGSAIKRRGSSASVNSNSSSTSHGRRSLHISVAATPNLTDASSTPPHEDTSTPPSSTFNKSPTSGNCDSAPQLSMNASEPTTHARKLQNHSPSSTQPPAQHPSPTEESPPNLSPLHRDPKTLVIHEPTHNHALRRKSTHLKPSTITAASAPKHDPSQKQPLLSNVSLAKIRSANGPVDGVDGADVQHADGDDNSVLESSLPDAHPTSESLTELSNRPGTTEKVEGQISRVDADTG